MNHRVNATQQISNAVRIHDGGESKEVKLHLQIAIQIGKEDLIFQNDEIQVVEDYLSRLDRFNKKTNDLDSVAEVITGSCIQEDLQRYVPYALKEDPMKNRSDYFPVEENFEPIVNVQKDLFLLPSAPTSSRNVNVKVDDLEESLQTT